MWHSQILLFVLIARFPWNELELTELPEFTADFLKELPIISGYWTAKCYVNHQEKSSMR